MLVGYNIPMSRSEQPNRFVRVRDDHASETAADYVELIDDLISKQGEARAVDIAAHLGVTHVTVTKTVQRLQREGLVTSQPYRSIFLTEAGRDLAEESRMKHLIVLDFLKALGVPPEIAETDAEGIEHHVSEATLSAMARFLQKEG